LEEEEERERKEGIIIKNREKTKFFRASPPD
jgi:hypothetical protein